MELSRIKILFGGLILQLLFTIAVPLPYNKYGRQCSDIGCLSTQVCVMAYDSCSLGQRDGSECGRYPTCKKKSDAGLAAGPSDNAQDLYSNNPTPPKASAPSRGGSSDDDVLASLGLSPDAPDNRNRPASRPNQDPYANPYPALPVNPQPRPPAPAPASPSGGNNNYYGGGGGGSGSAGNRHSGQFDPSGSNIVVPTQKPAAPSGGFFSGILGGIQNAVSNAVKQQVGTYINQRLGIGPATGGAGGLFDANRFIDTKNFGSLFSEKKPAGSASGPQPSGTGSSATGPYPVTVEQRSSVYSANAQPSYRGTSAESQYRRQGAAGTPPPYGWKLD